MSKVKFQPKIILVRLVDDVEVEEVLTLWTATQVHFERKFQRPFLAYLTDVDNLEMDKLCWLAWRQKHLGIKSPPKFDDWLLDVVHCFLHEDDPVVEEEEEEDPTPAAPQTASPSLP